MSRRKDALSDLVSRLAFITIANDYHSDAGETIILGENPVFGDADPVSALGLVIGNTVEETQGGQVLFMLPVTVWAFQKGVTTDALLGLEDLIADIKYAVEIEGRDQNALLGGDASVDRSLTGTLPKGLTRVGTTVSPRVGGSEYIGGSVLYELRFREAWGGE